MSKEYRVPVMELFGPTIQGEGIMSGTFTHFLRTGGCGLRCTWCDSMHAVLPEEIRKGRQMMTIGQIIERVRSMPAVPYLTLTGGDPCLHKHLGSIIMPLNMSGYNIAIETQGELFPDWLADADVITFSPKGPSSGNVVDWDNMVEWIEHIMVFGRRRQRICIKVVCFDDRDIDYALDIYRAIPHTYYDAFYFTGGTPIEPLSTIDPASPNVAEARAMNKLLGAIGGYRELADKMLMRCQTVGMNPKVHIGCQQHVIIWPEQDKGV